MASRPEELDRNYDGASQASSRRSRASGVGGGVANTSKPLTFSETTTTRWLTRYFPLFPVLLSLNPENLQLVSLLGMFISFMQHIGLLLTPHFSSEWGIILGNKISDMFYGFLFTVYDPALVAKATPVVMIVLDYFVLVLGVCIVCCILLQLRIREELQAEAKTTSGAVARFLLTVVSGPLLLPIILLCFASTTCNMDGKMPLYPELQNTQCWGGWHIATFIPGLLSFFIFLPLAYIKTVCVYDYCPLSDNLLAKRHTFMDKVGFICDVLNCGLFIISIAFEVPAVYSVLHALFSAIQVVGYIFLLPYYNMGMNRFYVCLHSVEVLASVFLTPNFMNYSFRTSGVSSALFLGFGLLLTVCLVLFTDFRVNPLFVLDFQKAVYCMGSTESLNHHDEKRKRRADSAYGELKEEDEDDDDTEDENDIRGFQIDDEEVKRLPYPKGLASCMDFLPYGALNAQVLESITRQQLNCTLLGGEKTKTRPVYSLTVPYINQCYGWFDPCLAVSYLDIYARKFGAAQISEMMLLFGANILGRAQCTYIREPFVLLCFINFITTYLPGLSFMGADLLKLALQERCSIEEAFRALKQANDLRTALGIRTHAHSIRSNKARATHGKILQLMNRFWVKLTEPSVNIKEVAEVADSIRSQRRAAIEQYDAALAQQQSVDPAFLRRLGDFFSQVLMSSDAAQECYGEARDIYEVRQARSMRGTRQHIVEVDVTALSERMRQLLRFHSAGGDMMSSKVSASGIIQVFSMILVIIFAFLVVICSLQLYLVTLIDNSLTQVLMNIYHISSLWTSSLRLGASVVMVESGFPATTLDDSLKKQISSLLVEFLNAFKHIVISTKDSLSSKELGPFVTMFTIPMYSIASQNSAGYSLWGLSEDFLQAVDRYINETNPIADAVVTNFNPVFILESAEVLSNGYENYLQLEINSRVTALSSVWMILLLVIFILNAILLMVAYASIIFVFERTSVGRVFTFQLFTLIPYDSLEKLATTARERYHQIHMEKSFRSTNGLTVTTTKVAEAPQPSTNASDNARKTDTVEVTKTTVLTYVKGKDVQLKSCLKKDVDSVSTAPAKSKKSSKKQVSFNPVVEVVGGGSDTKKEANAKEVTDGRNATPVAVGKVKQTKRVESTKFSKDNSSSSLKLLVLLFFIILICTLITLGALGFSFFGLQTYQRNMAELIKFERILNECSLKVPQGIESIIRFLFSGSMAVFQSAHDDIIGVINDIPNVMSTNIPSESVSKLVEMHKLAKILQNMSLDASCLASFSLGVSLAHWGDAYDRSQLTEAELSAQLQAKYPTEYAESQKIYAVTGSSVNENVIFSYVIMGDSVISSVNSFLSLCTSVYTEILQERYSTLPPSHTLICVALASACAPAAFALALAITPLHRYAQKYISRTFAFMVFISFCGVIAAVAYLVSQGDSIDLAFRPYSDALGSLVEFSSENFRQVLFLQSFVLTAIPYNWFQWKAISVYASSRYLSEFFVNNELNREAANLFSSVGEILWKLKTLGNVSSALAINSLQSAMLVEPPMTDALNLAMWDYSAQPDYEYNEVWFPEDIFYTTKAADLALSLDQQVKVAWTTTMGAEFYSRFSDLVETLQSLMNTLIVGENEKSMESKKHHEELLYVGLGLCGLPIVSLLFCAAKLRKAMKETYNANTGSRNTSIDQFKYQTMLQRTLIALMILGLFYAATFAVGIWITQTGFVYSREMTLSAGAEASVAGSLLTMWKVVSAQLSFASPAPINLVNRQVYNTLVAEFSGFYDNGVPIGLKQSITLDRYMFGNSDLAYMERLLSSFLTNRCGDYIMGNTHLGNESNYVSISGLKTTISAALTDWVAYMTQAYTDAEDPAATLSDISRNLTLNSELSESLLSATRTATNVLLNSFIETQEMFSDILLGLAVVSLLLTIFCFLVIGIPTIYRLFDEGHAVRTLLQIIPSNIRDEVPAIQQHVETGQISGSSELHRKFEQNEKLLQNILPQKIANRLKSGEQPIADTHECVTILFTDFVGFTKRSSTMQAGEIVAFLNEVFLEFDTVVELLALEKIKTIGDAFFMAGGLDPHVTDHALRVVEAGLMFFEALDEHNKRHPGRVPLQMRLGVHSGPVVAGVIGIKKVAYDLWGDSVEIANAMESTGVPGFVHISETTAAFVRGIFRLAPRGELPREKEHIPDDMPKTYLVVGRVLPTPYMHLRRPRLMPTNLGSDGQL